MKNVSRSCLCVFGLMTGTLFAADTWYWRAKVTCNDYAGVSSGKYGYSSQSDQNWVNAATGAAGVPRSGDFVIIDTAKYSPSRDFGSDFTTSLAFGGLTYKTLPNAASSNQGTFTLQAGGQGIVAESGVLLTTSQNFNGYVCFTGSGDAVVDIQNAAARLYIQKSFYGNADVTLVKRGAGTLQTNEGYAPTDNDKAPTKYKQARTDTTGYYVHRKFEFGAVKLQGGTLDLRQYYRVKNCQFLFDGDGTKLAVMELWKGGNIDLGVHSLELDSCSLNETEHVTQATHEVYGQSERCFLHFYGATASSSFSGAFTGGAGLVWEPTDSTAEFVFKKTVSPTTGILTVSNGIVRVTEGAGFSALSRLTVDGANACFAVDNTAGCDFRAIPLVIANDGKLNLAANVRMCATSVTVDGAVIADGLYSAANANWIQGAGVLRVGVPSVAEGSATATWTFAGTSALDTASSWEGGVVPDLDNAQTKVMVGAPVAGAAVMTLPGDVWVKGLEALNSKWVTVKAPADQVFAIGSEGLKSPSGSRLVLAAPPDVKTSQTWEIRGGGGLDVQKPISSFPGDDLLVTGNGWIGLSSASPACHGNLVISNVQAQVNVTDALGPAGAPEACICHPSGSKFPTFASGITVNRDLLIYDAGKSSKGSTTLTIPANATLTFNGAVHSTNTCALYLDLGAGSRVTFNKLFMSRDGGNIKGSGTVVFNGPYHCRDRFGMSGGTVELHATLNRLNGNLGAWSGGTIKTMVDYALEASNQTCREPVDSTNNSKDAALRTWLNMKNSAVLDLCGHPQSVDHVALHCGGGTITSDTAATLHVNRTAGYWAKHNYSQGYTIPSEYSTADGYGYECVDRGCWAGGVTLSYEATKPLQRFMTRASTSTGCIEVVSGRLIFLRRAATSGETFDLKEGTANPCPRETTTDGSWQNATAAVIKGGALVLEHSQVLGRDTDVKFEKTGNAYGKLELAAGASQKCFDLYVDGVRQPRGTWGATGSGAQHVDDVRFAGSGVLNVLGDGQGMIIIVR